jgi:hypothetical protein
VAFALAIFSFSSFMMPSREICHESSKCSSAREALPTLNSGQSRASDQGAPTPNGCREAKGLNLAAHFSFLFFVAHILIWLCSLQARMQARAASGIKTEQ